jgi:branched-chain amino acid transport system permease protein
MIDKLLLFGFTLSALYCLVAIGFTLIFGVGRIPNLSHGTFLMIAGYVFFVTYQVLGIPLGVGFLTALLASIAFGILIFKGLIEKIMGDPIKVVFSTLLIALIVEKAITLIWGDFPLNILPIIPGTIMVGGVKVVNNILAVLGISWVTILALLLFIYRSNLGRAIRAVSINREVAMIMGINVRKINMITWIVAGFLAGIAGTFYGSYIYLKPDVWVSPLIISFAIVVIGGIGSIKGSLVASHIIGFVESFTVLFIDERLRGVIALILLILILIFRPQGLFGEEA